MDRVAGRHLELGLSVLDEPWPAERFFLRSGHYGFARRGAPALLLFTGLHADHHRVYDEAAALDCAKLCRIARLAHHFLRTVADAEERPHWEPEARRDVVEEENGP